MTSLEGQPLQEFIKALFSKEKALRRWTQVIQQQYRKEESKNLDEILADVELLAEKMSNMESRALTDEDRILGWSSEYRFFESQREASLRRDASTAAWILDSPEYEKWKPGDKLFWLYGKCKQFSTRVYGANESQLDAEECVVVNALLCFM